MHGKQTRALRLSVETGTVSRKDLIYMNKGLIVSWGLWGTGLSSWMTVLGQEKRVLSSFTSVI